MKPAFHRLRTAFALSCAALLSCAAAAAELSTRGQLLDRVAAVVNDGVVTTSELEEQVAMISERLREQRTELPPPDVLRSQVLERLVLQEVQLQRADRIGLRISDEQLNAALAEVAQRNGLTL